MELNFCDWPTAAICAAGNREDYFIASPCRVQAVTNVNGAVTFHLRAGGGCAGSVRILADGVFLATRSFASPDQDHDPAVGAPDAAILAPKVGGSDPTGDLDCNGTVDAGDTSVLAAHDGHQCLVPTKVRQSRWGDLKVRYH